MKKLLYPLVLTLLTSCTVGPDFERPDVPTKDSYTMGKDPNQFGEQKTNQNKVVTKEWWSDFKSPELNQVMADAIKNSQTLKYAKSSWDQSKDLLDVEKAFLWPTVTLQADAGRTKYGASFIGSESTLIPPFTYYEIGPSLSYLIDVFGVTRRAIEQQEAMTKFHEYVYEASYLIVTGSVLDRVVMLAILEAEIEGLNDVVKEDKKNLELIEKKIQLGAATEADLIVAKNQLTQDQSYLPGIYKNKTMVQNSLNTIVGLSPAQWAPPKFTLAKLTLPKDLPMALPSELVRRRPDILAAESALHAACAAVGVATANMYPNITITGNILQEALTPAHLFRASSTAFEYVGGITAPLFNGGLLAAQKRAAERAYESSLVHYQGVVVRSFAQVNDILHSLHEDQRADQLGRKRLSLAKEALELARKAYQIGAVSSIEVLEAQRKYSQARIAYAQVQGKRLQDTALLYLAIGGRVN